MLNSSGKLFELKEWLTISEAAAHLSKMLSEEVSEVDILRLGLDGHLKLSVYFPNHTYARYGKVLPSKPETIKFLKQFKKITNFIHNSGPFFNVNKRNNQHVNIRYEESDIKGSKDFLDELFEEDFDFWPKGKRFPAASLISFDDEENSKKNNYVDLILKDDITIIKGVWDLPMLGAEVLDVEHMYQQLTNGPEISLQNISGVFVEGPDCLMCQLQESFDNNEFQSGSKGQLKIIKEYISSKKLNKEEADKLFAKHAEDREKYLTEIADRKKTENFYPAGNLPEDSVLVVRTQALIDLQNQISGEKKDPKKELNPNAEKSYLHIIGALLSCLTGDFKNKSFESEAKLRDFLDEKYDGIYGMSSRNLGGKFAEAKKALNDESQTLK